ncbi:MAG: hypothetical protein ACRDS0_03755 [Pseudonocardiaceae bacterium]
MPSPVPAIVVTVHRAAHATMHPSQHPGQPAHPAAHAADPGLGWRVWLFLFAAGLVFAILYRASITRHPYRNCRTCHGSGKHRGTIFTRSFRACDTCGGSGRRLRAFAKEPA